jgi:hypothetical protein
VRRKEGLNLRKKIGCYLTALELDPLSNFETKERESRVHEQHLRPILRDEKNKKTSIIQQHKKTLNEQIDN